MVVLVRRVCDNAASWDARRKRKLAGEMGRREKDRLKKKRKKEREGNNLPSFLTVSSCFEGYPRCPHRATPYGPANLVRDDWRRANPLIPFHLPIARMRKREKEKEKEEVRAEEVLYRWPACAPPALLFTALSA